LEGVPEFRSVYLPDGARWQDFWDGTIHEGGRTIDSATPLDRIPVFVRSGSILPFGGVVPHSEKQAGLPLELRVYPGTNADYVLYEDAGDGYGHEKGECSWIPFHWIDAEGTLVVGPREGAYPGMPASRRFLVRLMPAGLGQDAIEAAENTAAEHAAPVELAYSGDEIRVDLHQA
jgi:alpha-D-xyloside xylohydrolase